MTNYIGGVILPANDQQIPTRAESALALILDKLGGSEGPVAVGSVADALMAIATNDEDVMVKAEIAPRRTRFLPLLGSLIDQRLVAQNIDGFELTPEGRKVASSYLDKHKNVAERMVVALTE